MRGSSSLDRRWWQPPSNPRVTSATTLFLLITIPRSPTGRTLREVWSSDFGLRLFARHEFGNLLGYVFRHFLRRRYNIHIYVRLPELDAGRPQAFRYIRLIARTLRSGVGAYRREVYQELHSLSALLFGRTIEDVKPDPGHLS